MLVEWIPCAERLPSIGYPVCWVATHEQFWGMATLCDGKPCHSENYWWVEAQQQSLAQMFVTHWAEVEWPELPQRPELSDVNYEQEGGDVS